jgi:hypothetical protein
VNDVGEPCAGESHARFDGEGLETETPTTAANAETAAGNRTVSALPAYRHHAVHRASPSPNRDPPGPHFTPISHYREAKGLTCPFSLFYANTLRERAATWLAEAFKGLWLFSSASWSA